MSDYDQVGRAGELEPDLFEDDVAEEMVEVVDEPILMVMTTEQKREAERDLDIRQVYLSDMFAHVHDAKRVATRHFDFGD